MRGLTIFGPVENPLGLPDNPCIISGNVDQTNAASTMAAKIGLNLKLCFVKLLIDGAIISI